MDVQTKIRWRLGLALIWGPAVIVVVPGLINAFKGISQEKATGLAAVAGGFAEMFWIFGMVAFVVCEISGIAMLAKLVVRGQRAFSAIASIGCRALLLAWVGGAVWLIYFSLTRR
jgi:hypothetical protein